MASRLNCDLNALKEGWSLVKIFDQSLKIQIFKDPKKYPFKRICKDISNIVNKLY